MHLTGTILSLKHGLTIRYRLGAAWYWSYLLGPDGASLLYNQFYLLFQSDLLFHPIICEENTQEQVMICEA